MRFTGINHLAMVTGDMDSTIRFWRDLLGMRLISGFGEEGFRHYFFEIDPKNTIAFFEWDGAQAVEKKLHGQPSKGPAVFDHIVFGMESSEEAWELKDKLEAAGYECSDMIDHGFIHSFYSFDPNDIPIEFSYEVEGRDIHQNPVLHDSAPSASALEGADPQPGKWPEVTAPTPVEKRRVRSGDGSGLFRGGEICRSVQPDPSPYCHTPVPRDKFSARKRGLRALQKSLTPIKAPDSNQDTNQTKLFVISSKAQ